jgi:arginine decarboxylase-like protein
MRESFETGSFDTIPTAPTSNLHLSRAVANGILPRARHKRYTKNSILEVMCDRGLVHRVLVNTSIFGKKPNLYHIAGVLLLGAG